MILEIHVRSIRAVKKHLNDMVQHEPGSELPIRELERGFKGY